MKIEELNNYLNSISFELKTTDVANLLIDNKGILTPLPYDLENFYYLNWMHYVIGEYDYTNIIIKDKYKENRIEELKSLFLKIKRNIKLNIILKS